MITIPIYANVSSPARIGIITAPIEIRLSFLYFMETRPTTKLVNISSSHTRLHNVQTFAVHVIIPAQPDLIVGSIMTDGITAGSLVHDLPEL